MMTITVMHQIIETDTHEALPFSLSGSAAVFPGDGRTIEFPLIHSDIAGKQPLPQVQ